MQELLSIQQDLVGSLAGERFLQEGAHLVLDLLCPSIGRPRVWHQKAQPVAAGSCDSEDLLLLGLLPILLRKPPLRPLELWLPPFCRCHVRPGRAELEKLRAQVAGVVRELLHIADRLQLPLPHHGGLMCV
jgi:hypothetical protein